MLRKLSKYEILDEIGHGGMATVFRGRDSRLDRPVAVKILHPHLQSAPEARARFTREARSVARLHHPNILEIYDNSDESSEESYIVTELLTGPTLKAFVEKTGPMPAEIAAAFTAEIAQALGAAHDANIVHRDVKPENVLIHEQRTVKLTDFGIAQMVDSTSFTATGQILGSPGHMAPEQVDGADCDARADIFALGTVLYFLATGELPFQGRTPHQILRRIIDCDYPDPVRVRPAVGDRLAAIIRKSLARRPDDRFQTAKEFAEALRASFQEAGLSQPKAWVKRYLEDPERVRQQVEAKVLETHPRLGEKAVAAGDIPLALAYFNRVLAIDEQNKEVLDLIARLGRRKQLRTWAFGAGVVLGAMGLVALAMGYLPSASKGAPSSTEPAADVTARAQVDPPTRRPKGPPSPKKETKPESASVTDGPFRRSTRPTDVVFVPTPQNVAISVDGGELKQFGPAFRSIRLTPGRHRFRFVSEECCVEKTVTKSIPGGRSNYRLAVRLDYKPARLYITSRPSRARVSVDDGLVRGPTREVLSVPLRSSVEEVHTFTVDAEGFQPKSQDVRLRAGTITKVDVRLDPAPPQSPP